MSDAVDPALVLDTRGRWMAVVAGLAFLLGCGLRLAMGCESFWLDEAWSYILARTSSGPWQILAETRHDNNHILNTLFLYYVDGVVGDRGHWFWLRSFSLLSGIGALVLVWRIGLGWGRLEAMFAVILAAVSFAFISASGQARGYAPSLFFGLLLFVANRRFLAAGAAGWLWALGIWAISVLGVLAHATFAYTFISVVAASIWWLYREHRRWSKVIFEAARCYAVPAGFFGLLYFVYYQDLVVGGGPDFGRLQVARTALARTLGLEGQWVWYSASLAAILILAGLAILARRRDKNLLFFVSVLFAAPLAIVLITNPRVFYARYLVGCFPWFYLLVAILFASLWRRGWGWRVAVGLVLLSVIATNLSRAYRVLRVGRGDYADSVTYMSDNTEGPVLHVGSDNDFRNKTLLTFYTRVLPPGRRLRYHPRDQWPRGGPQWYLRHHWLAGRNPESELSPLPGLRYRLVKSFPHGAGPGFQWFLYRRQ